MTVDESDIILDYGSTISLFKDKTYLEDFQDANQNLVMETNAGSKLITQTGKVPGYGDVWYDAEAISNLFSVSDMVKKGHRVFLDTDIENTFVVRSRDGKTIKFPVDSRGLYVKEDVFRDGNYSDDSDEDNYPGVKQTTTRLEEDSDDEDVMPSLEERGN